MDMLSLAKDIADCVETESVRAKIPVTVTVIDVHGNTVLQHRMNGALAFSRLISERKAYTSALTRLRTSDLFHLVQLLRPQKIRTMCEHHCQYRSCPCFCHGAPQVKGFIERFIATTSSCAGLAASVANLPMSWSRVPGASPFTAAPSALRMVAAS